MNFIKAILFLVFSIKLYSVADFNVKATYEKGIRVPNKEMYNYTLVGQDSKRDFRDNQNECNRGNWNSGFPNKECYQSVYDNEEQTFYDQNIEFYWRGNVDECHTNPHLNKFLCYPIKDGLDGKNHKSKQKGSRDPDRGPYLFDGNVVAGHGYKFYPPWKVTWEGNIYLKNGLKAGRRQGFNEFDKLGLGRHEDVKRLDLSNIIHPNELQFAVFIPKEDHAASWDIEIIKKYQDGKIISQKKLFYHSGYFLNELERIAYPGITNNTVIDDYGRDFPKKYGRDGYYAWKVSSLLVDKKSWKIINLLELSDIKNCNGANKDNCPYIYFKLNYKPGMNIDQRGITLAWIQKDHKGNSLAFTAIPPEAFAPLKRVIRIVDRSFIEKAKQKFKNKPASFLRYVMFSPLLNKYIGDDNEYCLIDALRDDLNHNAVPLSKDDRPRNNKYTIGLGGNTQTILKQAYYGENDPSSENCFKLSDFNNISQTPQRISFEIKENGRTLKPKKQNDFLIQPLGYKIEFKEVNKVIENSADRKLNKSKIISSHNPTAEQDFFNAYINLESGKTYNSTITPLKYEKKDKTIIISNLIGYVPIFDEYSPTGSKSINVDHSYFNGYKEELGFDSGIGNDKSIIKGYDSGSEYNKPSPYLLPYLENNQVCSNVQKIKFNGSFNNYTVTDNQALKYKISLFDTKVNNMFKETEFGKFAKKVVDSGNINTNDDEFNKFKYELQTYGYRCNLRPDLKNKFEEKLGMGVGSISNENNGAISCDANRVSPAYAIFTPKIKFTFNGIRAKDNGSNGFIYSNLFDYPSLDSTPNKSTLAVLDIGLEAIDAGDKLLANFDVKCQASDIYSLLNFGGSKSDNLFYKNRQEDRANFKSISKTRVDFYNSNSNNYKDSFKLGGSNEDSYKNSVEKLKEIGIDVTDPKDVIEKLGKLDELYIAYDKKIKEQVKYIEANSHKYIVFDENSTYSDGFKSYFDSSDKFSYLFQGNSKNNNFKNDQAIISFASIDSDINTANFKNYYNGNSGAKNRFFKDNSRSNDNDYKVGYRISKNNFKQGKANIKIGISFDKELIRKKLGENKLLNPHNPFEVYLQEFWFSKIAFYNNKKPNESPLNLVDFKNDNTTIEKYNKYINNSIHSSKITVLNARAYLNDPDYISTNDVKYGVSGNAPSFDKDIRYAFYCENCDESKFGKFKGDSLNNKDSNWFINKLENSNESYIKTHLSENGYSSRNDLRITNPSSAPITIRHKNQTSNLISNGKESLTFANGITGNTYLSELDLTKRPWFIYVDLADFVVSNNFSNTISNLDKYLKQKINIIFKGVFEPAWGGASINVNGGDKATTGIGNYIGDDIKIHNNKRKRAEW